MALRSWTKKELINYSGRALFERAVSSTPSTDFSFVDLQGALEAERSAHATWRRVMQEINFAALDAARLDRGRT